MSMEEYVEIYNETQAEFSRDRRRRTSECWNRIFERRIREHKEFAKMARGAAE